MLVPRVLLLCSVLVLWNLGCGGAEAPHPETDEVEAVAFETTTILSQATLDALVSDHAGRLTFSGTPPQLANIDVDTVLVGGQAAAAPRGLCRMVTNVEASSEALVLDTEDVPLQVAFRKLHLRTKRRQVSRLRANTPHSQPLASAGDQDTDYLDVFAFNGDGNPDTEDDQVRVNGTLSGSLFYEFNVDTDWGEVMNLPKAVYDCLHELFGGGDCSVQSLLPPVQAGMKLDAGAEADLSLKGSAFLSYATEHEVLSEDLMPFMVGPVLVVPELEVRAEIDGSASSAFEFHGRSAASVQSAVAYSTAEGATFTPPQGSFDFAAPKVNAKLGADARIAIGPRLTARAFGLMGPYAGLRVFSELKADQTSATCWTVHGGVSGEVGFDASVHFPKLGEVNIASAGKEFTVVDEIVASGECEPLSAEQTMTPTAGVPSEDAFAHPSVAPWVRSYSDMSASHPAEATGAGPSWIESTGTIDGRFMVAGSASEVLSKLDPDGAPVWARSFRSADPFPDGAEHPLLPSRVVPRGDAGMFVVAYPWSLLSVSADGTLQWAKRFEAPFQSQWLRFTAAVARADGGVLLVGNRAPNELSKLDGDVWLVAVSASGEVLWSKRWGKSGQGEVAWTAFASGEDTIVAGSTHLANGDFIPFALRVTPDGTLKWATELTISDASGPQRAFFTAGATTAKGDMVLGGAVETAPRRGLVVKLTPEGKLAWLTAEGVQSFVVGPAITSIVALPSTGYLVAGDYTGAQGRQDVMLASLDGNGHTSWMRRYGGTGVAAGGAYDSDTHPSLTLTRDGGVLLTAYTDSLAERGVLAAKLRAQDGVVAFEPSSGGEVADLTAAPASFDASQQPRSTQAPTLPAELRDMDVTATAVGVSSAVVSE